MADGGFRSPSNRIESVRSGIHFAIDPVLGQGPLATAVSAELIWLVRVERGRLREMWTYQRR